ncbi:MAG: hypothetical protein ABI851_12115 [Saprospiraceae bacterium]
MIKAELINTNGKSILIPIPERASEIKLLQYIDFNTYSSDLIEWLKENHEQIESKKWQYIIKLIDCLKAFYGDLVDFFELDSSYIDGISKEDLSDHIEIITGKKQDHVTATDTLIQIYNMIFNVIKDSKPELRVEKHFFYKGQQYEIPAIWSDTLWNKTNFESVSVKQAIEVLQVQSNYNDVIKDLAKDDKSIANFAFHKYLSEVSLLALKPDEKIPLAETEFKKFMSERIDLFQDIDLQTVLDIENWFEMYYSGLRDDKENYYYFNSKEPGSPEELIAIQKAKKKNEEVQKRIGWKSFISRMVELRSFSGREKTELESVYTAPFTDAVKMVSIDNSN